MADTAWLSQIFQNYQESGLFPVSRLGDAMRGAGMNPTAAEVSQMLPATEAGLTLDSFCHFMQDALAKWSSRDQAQELLSSFQVFDVEGTGYLSKPKILEIMRMGGNQFPESKLQEMLQSVPLNSQGLVEYQWLIPYLLGPIHAPRPTPLSPAARFRRAVRLPTEGLRARGAMFACCVPDPKQEAELVETKTLPVLSEKAIQAEVKGEAAGVFSVVVPAKRHTTLGLEMDTSADVGPIIVEVKRGAVGDFNQLNPVRTIQPFDMIAILLKMADPISEDIKMTLQRPRRMEVSLLKQASVSLGVKLVLKENIPGAVVSHVEANGLIATWNKQNPSETVQVSDRLLAVNGITQVKENLAEELKKETELVLTFLKY
eukprot:symbB.v1.2.036258.t1/scaffold5077.1/size31199/1